MFGNHYFDLFKQKYHTRAYPHSQDSVMKKSAKRAMTMLKGIATVLPPGASFVTICNQLPELITKIF